MQDESLLDIFVIAGILILGSFALAAFILWLKDRPGFIGRSVQAMLGMVVLTIGLAILAFAGYLIATSQLGVSNIPRIVFGVGLPISMVAIGWLWIRGVELGIADQDIDYDSPELRDSVSEARARLPQFIEQVMRDEKNASIKFPFITDQGVTEHLWGYVHGYDEGSFEVSLLNEPYSHEGELADLYDVPESAVEDWQILHSDGRVSGSYSTIASFRYLERTGVRLNRTMRKQKTRLIDA
ncbi:MAG: hypothetical protein AMXMBFR82_05000 [Candidatus Hydrogenedentota bacterium]